MGKNRRQDGKKCIECQNMEKDKELVLKNEHVKYEYEGYQVRVYFSSDKTLKQCIQNLAERRIGG